MIALEARLCCPSVDALGFLANSGSADFRLFDRLLADTTSSFIESRMAAASAEGLALIASVMGRMRSSPPNDGADVRGYCSGSLLIAFPSWALNCFAATPEPTLHSNAWAVDFCWRDSRFTGHFRGSFAAFHATSLMLVPSRYLWTSTGWPCRLGHLI
jgi:hypothetical protein